MKYRIGFLGVAIFFTGCSFSSSLESNSFVDVWKDYAQETTWSRQSSMSQEEMEMQFLAWSQNFEKKYSLFVRLNEEGILEGSTIISGTNLAQNIKEYKAALGKLQTITEKQDELKTLIRQVCEKQKSPVPCGL